MANLRGEGALKDVELVGYTYTKNIDGRGRPHVAIFVRGDEAQVNPWLVTGATRVNDRGFETQDRNFPYQISQVEKMQEAAKASDNLLTLKDKDGAAIGMMFAMRASLTTGRDDNGRVIGLMVDTSKDINFSELTPLTQYESSDAIFAEMREMRDAAKAKADAEREAKAAERKAEAAAKLNAMMGVSAPETSAEVEGPEVDVDGPEF